MVINSECLRNYNANRKPIHQYSSVSENESLFETGLNFILDSNEQIMTMMSNIYIESDILSEGFKEKFNQKFNFCNIVKFIIDLFIKMIAKLYNRFDAIVTKALYQNTSINKYMKDLKSFNSNLKLSFDYFNYTYLDKDIPSQNLNMWFHHEYDNLLEKFKKLHEMNDSATILTSLNNIYNATNDDINKGRYYDKFRLRILVDEDYDEPVSREAFPQEIFVTFRGGMYEPAKDAILPSYEFKNVLERFESRNKIQSSISNHRNTIENAARKTEKMISRINPSSYIDPFYSNTDIETAFNNILKLKSGQLTECCNIITMAFAAKLDAAKEAAIQDKKVIFEAINTIILLRGEDK